MNTHLQEVDTRLCVAHNDLALEGWTGARRGGQGGQGEVVEWAAGRAVGLVEEPRPLGLSSASPVRSTDLSVHRSQNLHRLFSVKKPFQLAFASTKLIGYPMDLILLN